MSADGPRAPDGDATDRDEATRSFVAGPHDARSQAVPFPRVVGDYHILSKIGEGGMGLVFEAEQRSPRRRVALKVVRGGEFVDDTRVRMFQREADTLARLKHPNIGAIYGSGRTDDGQHFFAMELVRGQTLDVYMSCRPSITDRNEVRFRLAVLRKIAEAVHYAHQRGVIHRDLKPSNIIVTEEYAQSDARDLHAAADAAPRIPEIKILDFGLARITEGDISQASLVTEAGVIKGTLAYMSPEQARGNPEEIDIRSDVYSLGVILYEMLASVRPYDTSRGTLLEALRVICEHEPPSLRGRVSAVTRLHTDLELIVAKALAKEPDRRYGSAAELAADITRHLTSQPILARPPSTLYQLQKFASRNRALVGAVAATIVVLAAGVVVSTLFAIEAARGRERAEWNSYVGNLAAAEGNLRINSPAGAKSRLVNCPPHLRGWEWSLLSRQADVSDIVIREHEGQVFGVAISPDGKRLATAGRDGTLRLFDAVSGHLEAETEIGPTTAFGVAFSPDGTQVAVGSGDRSAWIWDAATLEPMHTLRGHTDSVYAVAFDSSGRRLVTGSWDATVRLWDLESGSMLREYTGHEGWVFDVTFDLAGDRLLSAAADGTARLWNAADGSAIATLAGHEAEVWGAAFSPDGKRIVTGSGDKTVRLWDSASGKLLDTWDGLDSEVQAIAFDPSGGIVAAGGQDGSIRLLAARSGVLLATLSGHEGAVFGLGFSPDGTRLASGAMDGTARLWDAAPVDLPSQFVGHAGTVAGVAFDHDGGRIASAGSDNTVRLWDAESGEPLATLVGDGERFGNVAFSPDGVTVAASSGVDIRVWNAERGELSAILVPAQGGTYGVAFSPDGALIASGATGGFVSVWHAASGELATTLTGAEGNVSAVAFSRDGSRVAAGAGDHKIYVWNVSTGAIVSTLAGHENLINSVAVSPDGSRLASGSGDGTIRLWDLATGGANSTLRGHGGPVRTVAFSADGARIVSGGDDRTVRIWEGTTGELLATLTGSGDMVGAVAFSPDGRSLAAGSNDRIVRIWNIESPDEGLRLGAMARAYEQRGEDGAAEPFRRKAVDRRGSASEADAVLRANELAALGSNLVRQHDFANARVALLEAHAALPSDADASWRAASLDSLLGRALAGDGRVQDAAPKLTSSLKALLPAAAPLAVRCDALGAVDAFLSRDGGAELVERRLAADLDDAARRELARLLLDCPSIADGVARAARLAADELARASGAAGALREILVQALVRQNELTVAMQARSDALALIPAGPSHERSRLEGLRPAFEARAWSLSQQGDKQRGAGRLDEAAVSLASALQVQRAFLSPDDWRIGLTASRLGFTLADLGRQAEGEPLILEGAEKLDPSKAKYLERAGVTAHRRETLQSLATFYEKRGQPERAAEWRTRLEAEALP